jgi:hypothetical protein
MSTKACYRSLCAAGERLDPVLKPLGYVFEPDAMIPGLPFVSAVFIQGELVINIYYRRGPTFGPVMYANARGGMTHDELMRTLGLADRQLLVCDEAALRSISLVGGDPIDALIADLTLAAPALQDPATMNDLIVQSIERRTEQDCPTLAASPKRYGRKDARLRH